jgi:hypothetical protein
MDSFEYMRIPTKLIPHEIIDQYNLLPLVYDGHVYIEVQKGMYGLSQAGILANCQTPPLCTIKLDGPGLRPTHPVCPAT